MVWLTASQLQPDVHFTAGVHDAIMLPVKLLLSSQPSLDRQPHVQAHTLLLSMPSDQQAACCQMPLDNHLGSHSHY